MKGEEYFEKAIAEIARAKETQWEAIGEAALLIADSIAQGGLLHVFGCGHSQILAEEIFYRAGGLVPINAMLEPALSLREATKSTFFERLSGFAKAILDSYQTSPGEAIIIVSASGRNAVPIEMAMVAKERGLKVIALTSLAYSQGVDSRHPSGKKLYQLADLVLDTNAIPGDAALEVPGAPYKVGPTSAVVGIAILWALMVEVVDALVERGVKPPVWLAGNVPGGDEVMVGYLREYRHRIKHL